MKIREVILKVITILRINLKVRIQKVKSRYKLFCKNLTPLLSATR